MKRSIRYLNWALVALLVVFQASFESVAKSYSSGGGKSYSSSRSSSSGSSRSTSSGSRSSSRSANAGRSSSGGTQSSSSANRASNPSSGKSFRSSAGRSYSSGSGSSDDSKHSYQSSKSYSSGASHSFRSSWFDDKPDREKHTHDAAPSAVPKPKSDFTFDAAAARARQEETSQREFKKFKESQTSPSRPSPRDLPPVVDAPIRETRPPSTPASSSRTYQPPVYVPEPEVLVTRPVRLRTVFAPYYSRPTIVYHDPYSNLFWWWLLDRSLDERAWWAYHHRYDMDSDRYQALVASDQRLEARVAQLESEQTPRDPTYVPAGLDRDLMFSDQHVSRVYENRPTLVGVVTFWIFAVPLAVLACGFFIWLIWFKRWPTAT